MKVMINGYEQDVRRSRTVLDLFAEFKLTGEGTALILNGEVVPRTDFATTPLGEGDDVEIVRMVGGG